MIKTAWKFGPLYNFAQGIQKHTLESMKFTGKYLILHIISKFQNTKNYCHTMFSEPNKSMLPSNTRKTALIFRISILKTSKKHKHIQLHLHSSYVKAKDKIVVFLKISEISTNFKSSHPLQNISIL